MIHSPNQPFQETNALGNKINDAILPEVHALELDSPNLES